MNKPIYYSSVGDTLFYGELKNNKVSFGETKVIRIETVQCNNQCAFVYLDFTNFPVVAFKKPKSNHFKDCAYPNCILGRGHAIIVSNSIDKVKEYLRGVLYGEIEFTTKMANKTEKAARTLHLKESKLRIEYNKLK